MLILGLGLEWSGLGVKYKAIHYCLNMFKIWYYYVFIMFFILCVY